LAASAALLATFPLAHAFTPFLMRDAIPVCPFRIATGKPCPFCGLTRAVALATHGRWPEAFRMNPLWPVFAAAILCLSILFLIDACSGLDTAGRFGRALSKRWILILSALIMFGIGRIAFGTA
jgi:hypothetical protein